MSSSRYAQASRTGGGPSGNNNSSLIGANEDMFLQAFDSTPKLNIGTQKKLENELQGVMAIISNPHAEWNNRVKAIQHFRTLVNSGIADTDDFHTTTLKTLEIPFQNNICDLRSQVVRETCITIAFLSCRLQQKFSRMAEILLPSLIKLIPNSAKIMSTSALVALRFIIQSTHNSRLITIIKYQLSTSKSKDIHRALCEIAERIVSIWPAHVIERHLNDLQEVLRLGICNSDEAARQYARRAFNVFAENFSGPADKLFNSLDQQRQRMLNNLNHGGGSTLTMNGYGSTASNLNTAGLTTTSTIGSTAQSSSGYGPSSIASSVNLVSRLKGPIASSSSNGTSGIATASPSRIRTPTARSTSAIDVNAQRRARARAVYLSSMYTRPRQFGTLNSPAKSTIPTSTTINHQHTPTSNMAALSAQAASAATPTNHHQHHPTSNMPQQQQQQHITVPQPHYQYTQNLSNSSQSSSNTNNNNNSNHNNQNCNFSSLSNQSTPPPVGSAHQQLQQLQQQQAASAEKKDGIALSKAAAYLLSVVNNNTIAENQIVTTMKYLNSLIEKHPADIVSKYLPELMPPLVVGIDNAAISVRKASVFAMVSINSKVGLKEMESYLTSLTMTQKKLLEVYIRKFKEENKGKGGDNQETTTRRLSSSVVNHSSSSSTLQQPEQQQITQSSDLL